MLSLLIVPPSDPALASGDPCLHFALTLAQCASLAVDEIVRDGAVIGEAGRGLEAIAEQAGCPFHALHPNGFITALGEARCSRVLILEAGYGLRDVFAGELNQTTKSAYRLLAESNGFLSRNLGFMRTAGICADRLAASKALETQGAASLKILARRLGAHSLKIRARRLV